ncbi:hypothetical protein IU449_20370 [Nocardia higoensis]|uniref:Uncharacterized protein n=1 Tax=Nocardia higoensis TaxID=228599 RepID=A0ABS0DG81_9NOCA|nr:hypothetical protein [Nocardia higoensis]MBF6356868.1 hypothetical protein [Nocardia higoensis]
MSQGVVSSTGPGGVAATVAVWFAVLAAAANLISLLVLGGSFVTDSGVYDNSLAVSTVLGAALLAGVFAYGALRMYRGEEEGRVTVLLGAGAWLAFALVGLLTSLSGYESDYGVHWSQPGGTAVDVAIATAGLPGVIDALVHGAWLPSAAAVILPLIVVLVTAAPATTRWFARADPGVARAGR